jgi:large subunit ribosomal protein L19
MSEEIQKNSEGVAEQAPAENKAEAKSKVERKPRNKMVDINKAIFTELGGERFTDFAVGDTVRVYVKIVEGDKQRIQPFEGTVLAVKHGGVQKTFMVRRISQGVAIERVFPFSSPFVEKVEVVRKGRVRRAKLYYLRGRFGRSAVITEKV